MASVLVAHTRQTIRECMYFRSCDRDGGHNIQSAISENPTGFLLLWRIHFPWLFQTKWI